MIDLGMNGELHGFRPFTADSAFNTRIDNGEVDPESSMTTDLIAENSDAHVLIDAVVPYYVVDKTQPLVEVFVPDQPEHDCYPAASDLPFGAPIPDDDGWFQDPGSTDSHGTILERDTMTEYDIYFPTFKQGKWFARITARYNLLGGDLQRAWLKTGCTASGLPMFPLLLKLEEAQREIRHALGITLRPDVIAGWFTPPATHPIYSSTSPGAVGNGTRFRLRQDFDEAHYGLIARNIIICLKRYGAIMYDAGADLFIPAVKDDRWLSEYKDDLESLWAIQPGDFEIMQIGPRYSWDNLPPGYVPFADDDKIEVLRQASQQPKHRTHRSNERDS